MQNKFKSPVVWATLATLAAFVLKTYFNYEIPQFDQLIVLVFAALMAFGILNNPDDKNNF